MITSVAIATSFAWRRTRSVHTTRKDEEKGASEVAKMLVGCEENQSLRRYSPADAFAARGAVQPSGISGPPPRPTRLLNAASSLRPNRLLIPLAGNHAGADPATVALQKAAPAVVDACLHRWRHGCGGRRDQAHGCILAIGLPRLRSTKRRIVRTQRAVPLLGNDQPHIVAQCREYLFISQRFNFNRLIIIRHNILLCPILCMPFLVLFILVCRARSSSRRRVQL
ncbi:hypothetical protein DF3PA_10243 [Candidatus Defluviicoccus seviourii]|uniref:Uncharacterized protein n=1 Tax=Candidatus Defluviicoccus seviourii TaxID=2565273 RepID=A0A564W9J6_9PROT|nr:hypothetical protein DF3PA_10243 [Candidatus Defluviicoccus seviourii]